MSVSAKQRKEWEEEIRRDYPNINNWILTILMDVYCSEGGKQKIDAIIKEDIRNSRRGRKQAEQKPREADIYGQATVADWSEEWERKLAAFHESVNAKVIEKNNECSIVEECPPTPLTTETIPQEVPVTL
jgi:hypothetical protein